VVFSRADPATQKMKRALQHTLGRQLFLQTCQASTPSFLHDELLPVQRRQSR
jgi:hypothetical protein